MPTVKKQVLGLLDELEDKWQTGYFNQSQNQIEFSDIIDEIRELIQDNLLVSKDVFND
jgi:predicted ATPase|tara:strand:+ start:130 stop:303 length:174 start_codon:yes stop_codon:yes gene_type:complete